MLFESDLTTRIDYLTALASGSVVEMAGTDAAEAKDFPHPVIVERHFIPKATDPTASPELERPLRIK